MLFMSSRYIVRAQNYFLFFIFTNLIQIEEETRASNSSFSRLCL